MKNILQINILLAFNFFNIWFRKVLCHQTKLIKGLKLIKTKLQRQAEGQLNNYTQLLLIVNFDP